MAYTNFTNCTKQQYTNIIYSQEDINRIRIWFNNVEFTDAGEYCVSLTGTNRILPTDGSKRFTLSNFIAKEYDLVLRDVPQEVVIQDQVKISIGTLVDETNGIYEDVPIGIFNIQDTPTTDNNQITIKLRDNRVKFDFNYNAQPLIEQSGGSATLGAILNDMCTKAGVTNDVSSFVGDDIAVAIYDNTIKATNYVGYIAEQAGAIPIITREGHLDFVYLDNLQTWQIPLDIVEKYELGTPYQIERVVYESGTIKYETSSDITLDTLYLDSSNMYITTQAQVNTVFGIVEDFELDSALTGKVLGNPAIDPHDIIEIYGYYTEDEDGNATFVADTNTIVLRTLANNTYNYSGVSTNTFETQIGKEERKENVIKSGDESFKAWARSEINNLDVRITNTVGKVGELEETVYGEYVLTEDTTFIADKTYYVKVGDDDYEPYEQYELTTDETFQSGTTYYYLVDGEYEVYSNYNVGDEIPENTIYIANYTIGSSIPSNTYYDLIEQSSLEKRLSVAEETLTEQGLTLEIKTAKIDNEGNAQEFLSTGSTYSLTSDSTFQSGKQYYKKSGSNYIAATVTVGDTIPSNTYYEKINANYITYSMNKDGLSIADNVSGYKSITNSTGQFYYDNNEMIGKYTKDGSVQKDLALYGRYFYGIDDDRVNVEQFKKDDAMFMAQLYEAQWTDENNNTHTETGFGHFYNGS